MSFHLDCIDKEVQINLIAFVSTGSYLFLSMHAQ